jgi:hypothetical protein
MPTDPHAASTWFLARRLFLGGIALTYLVAFGSLAGQVLGLYGADGIVPLSERMAFLRAERHGWERLEVPTLLWLGASDAALRALCFAGMGAAVLALVGRVPRGALCVCWLLYLSFVSVGSPFLDFQWDVLLLEAGLLAVLFAPGGVRPFGADETPPADFVRGLVYLLLFKLLVLSGALKLASGDPSWHDGTALDYHYWTQPLPHRLSVLAAGAPAWFHRASVLAMLVIELGLPWLLLVPFARRRLRQLVAAGTWLLMLAVLLTGNYGFFNLLTAVLAVPLLDDRAWRVVFRRGPPRAPSGVTGLVVPRWRRALPVVLGAPLAVLSLAQIASGLGWLGRPPAPLLALERALAPFRSVNPYGLFRVMTKERLEVRVEGSADGRTWRPYRFRYKPDDPARAPAFAGLHMPRLDWQMWFLALEHGSPQRSRWATDFLDRLLAGSPDVLALLADDPFAGAPPRFVRAQIAPYRFAPPAERAVGTWWQRGGEEVFLQPRAGPR